MPPSAMPAIQLRCGRAGRTGGRARGWRSGRSCRRCSPPLRAPARRALGRLLARRLAGVLLRHQAGILHERLEQLRDRALRLGGHAITRLWRYRRSRRNSLQLLVRLADLGAEADQPPAGVPHGLGGLRADGLELRRREVSTRSSTTRPIIRRTISCTSRRPASSGHCARTASCCSRNSRVSRKSSMSQQARRAARRRRRDCCRRSRRPGWRAAPRGRLEPVEEAAPEFAERSGIDAASSA
jgi:hypothetical protein